MFQDKAFTKVYIVTTIVVAVASGITALVTGRALGLIFLWTAVCQGSVMFAYERGKKSKEWKRFGR